MWPSRPIASPIVSLGGFSPSQQGAGARLDPYPQVGSASPGRFGEQIQGIAPDARVAGACGSFDQLGQRPPRDIHVLVLAGLPSRGQCLLVTAQAVVQDCGHPVRDCHRDSLAPGCGLLDDGLDQRDGLGFPAPECSQHGSGDGRETRPVASQTAPASAISKAAAAKSPLHTVLHSHTVQKERELVERAEVTGELNLPDGHAPALVVPESFIRHRGDKAPPEYFFLGDVWAGKGARGPPQRRCSGGRSIGDQQRKTVQHQIDQTRRMRWRGEDPGGAGDLKQVADPARYPAKNAACHASTYVSRARSRLSGSSRLAAFRTAGASLPRPEANAILPCSKSARAA